MGVAIALVIIYGGAQAIAGKLLLGSLVGFVLYTQRFFDPIRDLSIWYTELQRAMAGGQRAFEVLDTKPEIVDRPGAIALPPVFYYLIKLTSNKELMGEFANNKFQKYFAIICTIVIVVASGFTVASVFFK